jgi:selenocysteine-specific elongation factor
MRSIIIGTAGHIDHGKSSLVRALTGKDPDRLPEEKRRGITIDLGFADLDLGDARVGFVDVPGHERFVKNMLAGVHGIDAVALVIAADEGVMPQTREHFEICRLLGVREGLVVLTKTDLVEDELLALVRAEAQELVAGSFLESAATVAASARSGAGLEELRRAFSAIAAKIPERSTDFVTRLPIDRVFTMKGFGAVVTGTLVSGEISPADELDLLPVGKRVRVRGVQVHSAAVERAHSGQRTAVNLAGVDVTEIERGMVLAAPGRLTPTQIIDVELNVLPTAPRAIRTRSRLRVHIGAAEVLARTRVLEPGAEILPGANGFAQLRFETPVIATHDERFIIRSYSPAETIAGGRVLDPLATKHRGRELAKTHRRLENLLEPDRTAKLATFVETAGDQGLRLAGVAARTGWTDAVIANVLEGARKLQPLPLTECEGVLISSANFRALCDETAAEVNRHHKREPLSRGLPRETLRERRFVHVAPEVFRAVIRQLETEGTVVAEKDLVRAKEHGLSLTPDDELLRDKIAHAYQQAGLEAPALDQVFGAVGLTPARRSHGRKIFQLLLDDGTLVRVQGEMFFHARALRELEGLLLKFAAEHEPERLIDVPKFKELARVSRKYAIPLLEYFDSKRITVRAGDKRVIVKR